MEYTGNTIAIYNDQNIPIECDIVAKFKNEDTGKSYLVYTDNSINEFGVKNMFVCSYRPEIPEEDKLIPVETVEEWEEIQGFLMEIQAALDEKKEASQSEA